MFFRSVLFLGLFLAPSFPGNSIEQRQTVTHHDYQSALSAGNYLRFDLTATQLWFFAAGFTGVVREFSVSGDYDKKSERIRLGLIRFSISAMDLDNDNRNQKMRQYCLDQTHYPEISILLLNQIVLNQSGTQEINASIELRGKKKSLLVKLQSVHSEDGHLLSGESDTSFSGLEIPDPSSFLVKAQDNFKLSFQIRLKRPE